MIKRWIVVAALAAIIALPFLLRTKQASPQQADETLVIITPHNEAIRSEYARAFREWYRKKTGKTVTIDWRVIGGTSEIARFLEGEYVASFQLYWTHVLGKPWSVDIQSGFQNGRLPTDADPLVKEARESFLKSDVGCGMDLFFGGGTYDFERQAQAGRLVSSGVLEKHPEWFNDQVIPQHYAGEEYWDKEGRWLGSVLSNYGMLTNLDSFKRLGLSSLPQQWEDLKNPKLIGEIALADPTKSGSIAKAFENVIQQQMQKRLVALKGENPTSADAAIDARAIREGWIAGMRMLQLIGANARYFTDTSQKPAIDVAQGDSAVGMCIDFYGRQQEEAVQRRDHSSRLNFVLPVGGTVSSVDPIALLRGAKSRETATAFIEYLLSVDGQKIWNFRPGTPGGPERFALRRLPIRRDLYTLPETKEYGSDPTDRPYEAKDQLIYREPWTGRIFREMAFVIRVMTMDTHVELTHAWRAIIEAGQPEDALAVLQDLSAVDYEQVNGSIRKALNSKNKVDEIRLANELGTFFRQHYQKAEELARRHGSVALKQ